MSATATTEREEHVAPPPAVHRHLWLIALVVGTVAWLVGAVITEITDDTVLVPNVIIVGTFLVPACTVLYVLSREHEAHLTVQALILGFLAAGTAGVVLSAVTETYLLPDHVATNIGIALIEESGKAGVLLLVASMVRPRVPRDGMVLGATIGAGFAAFESAGYALRVLIDNSDDHSIIAILETEAQRAVLAPFGHITWTAIAGGALFASAWADGRIKLDRHVAWTFAGITALHALWDASHGLAIRISQGLGGEGWTFGWPNNADWIGTPTGADLTRFNVVYFGLLTILGTIGIVWALRRWRAYQIDRWAQAHPR